MKRKIVLFFTMILIALCAIGALVACGGDDDYDDGGAGVVFFMYHHSDGYVIKVTTEDLLINHPSFMSRTGYTFEGAFDKPNGKGKQYFNNQGYRINGTRPTENMDIYAHWEPKVYTIVLKDGEEEFRRIPNVTYDSELAFFDVPQTEKTGYVFAGWGVRDEYVNRLATNSAGQFYTGQNTLNEKNGFSIYKNNVAYIYAVYDYEQYDITLNYNALAENRVIKAYYDHAIENLPEFEPQDGYEFIGWSYENSTVDYTLYNNEKITGPITLYAIVLRYREFVIYDGDGNKLATKRVYDNGETIRLAELELELPAGYKANNWYNNSTMSGSSRITAVNYNTVTDALYTDIVPIEYTAELIVGNATVNGGTRITYTCEDIVPLPTADKEHCISFLGWCTDEELISAPIMRIPKGTIGNIKLYPKFKGVDVTLNLYPQNGGSEYSVTREYGQKFILNSPIKLGYTFTGWYGSEQGGTQYTGADGKSISAIDFVEPLNLYAQWKLSEYTVSYVDGDGNALTSQTYEHGQRLVFPSEPTDDVRTFSGWYDKDYRNMVTAGIKITQDMTVYALFVESTEITTADQLKAIAQNPSGNYHLGADINLGGETWTPINNFTGVLDGKGHKIFNFKLSLIGNIDSRNFGFVRTNNGTIMNLCFDMFTWNVNISLNVSENDVVNVSVIAGWNNKKIINCSVKNDLPLNSVFSSLNDQDFNMYPNFQFGVISGENHGQISTCSIDVDINLTVDISTTAKVQSTGWVYVGGIVGYNYGSISKCDSNLKYTGIYKSEMGSKDVGTVNINVYSGGIVGTNRYASVYHKVEIGRIEGCFADVKLSNTNSDYRKTYIRPWSGGILGNNRGGIIEKCYATGTVKGRSLNDLGRYGGFVANNEENGRISDSYCNASVECEYGEARIGGFIGYNEAKIQNCYFDGSVIIGNDGNGMAGAFVGCANSGSIVGCYALGSVTFDCTTVTSDKRVGKFAAYYQSASIVSKCYYGDSVVAVIGGNSVNGTSFSAVKEKPESVLMSREFLVDELFWDDEVWVIDGANNPKLAWQD